MADDDKMKTTDPAAEKKREEEAKPPRALGERGKRYSQKGNGRDMIAGQDYLTR